MDEITAYACDWCWRQKRRGSDLDTTRRRVLQTKDPEMMNQLCADFDTSVFSPEMEE